MSILVNSKTKILVQGLTGKTGIEFSHSYTYTA
jgi:succinyl-CoA synthetase alpha subunit